ncbi:MAG: hypothetical protein K6F52_03810, partial [Clostridia bacterium]|nr:hypothetical protein [Clostridia bacterium]
MKNLARMRILSIALSLAVMLSMMPMAGIFVYADDEPAPVQQVDGEDGQSAPVQQVGGENGQSALVQQVGGENGQAAVQQAGGENGQVAVQQAGGTEGEATQQTGPKQAVGGEEDGGENQAPMLLKSTILKKGGPVTVSNGKDFLQAVKDECSKITLDGDIRVTMDHSLGVTKDLEIDLNKNTMTLTSGSGIVATTGVSISIHDGTVEAQKMGNGTKSVFSAWADASIIAKDITLNTNGTGFFPNGDSALLSIENSKITAGTYGVGTNHSTKKVGIVINLKKTEFESTGYKNNDGDDATIMINQPGTINMEKCKITCHRIGVFARAGQVNLIGVQIDFDGNNQYYGDYMKGNGWEDGNNVISAAVVVGDNGSKNNKNTNAYKDPADVVLENVTINAGNAGDKRAIVVSQDEDATATVTVKSGTINGEIFKNNSVGEGTIKIQGGTFTADPTAYVEDGCTVGMLVADENSYRAAVESNKVDKIKFAGNITIPEGEKRHVLTRNLDIDL